MESTISIEVGQVVRSKAGRDADKIFLIYRILDDSYVYIVDGKLRKLKNPKKKKIKHLIKYTDKIDLEIKNLNDSYIRKALKSYL